MKPSSSFPRPSAVLTLDSDSDELLDSPQPRRGSSPELFAPEFTPPKTQKSVPTYVAPSFGPAKSVTPLRLPKKAALAPSGAPAKRASDSQSPTARPQPSASSTTADSTHNKYPNEGTEWDDESIGLLVQMAHELDVLSKRGLEARAAWAWIGEMLGRKAWSCLEKRAWEAGLDYTQAMKFEAQKDFLVPPPSNTGRPSKHTKKKKEKRPQHPPSSDDANDEPLRKRKAVASSTDGSAAGAPSHGQPTRADEPDDDHSVSRAKKSARWSSEDKMLLFKLVREEKYMNGKVDWARVASHFPGRTKNSVAQQYQQYKHLDPGNAAPSVPARPSIQPPAPRPTPSTSSQVPPRTIYFERRNAWPQALAPYVRPPPPPPRGVEFEGKEIFARNRLTDAQIEVARAQLMHTFDLMDEEWSIHNGST